MYDLHNTSALDDHNEHSTWSHGGHALETPLDGPANVGSDVELSG